MFLYSLFTLYGEINADPISPFSAGRPDLRPTRARKQLGPNRRLQMVKSRAQS